MTIAARKFVLLATKLLCFTSQLRPTRLSTDYGTIFLSPIRKSEHIMRKVIRGYAKDKNLNLILIGTIPVAHSNDKRSPAARQDKRYLVRQGATIFKKETIR